MRLNILATGVFLMFLALLLQASSQISIEVEPSRGIWTNVNSNEANPPEESLSVEANLTNGDEMRMFYSLQKSSSNYYPNGFGIKMNLTAPGGNVTSFIRHVEIDEEGKIVVLDFPAYPTVTANHTGAYRVDGQSLGGVVLIRLLTIQKYELTEPKIEYPYLIFTPASIVVFLIGVALLFWGALSSKGKKTRRSRFSKTPIR